MKISRWIVSILLLCMFLVRAGAQEKEEPAADLIELSLGYGFGAPPDSGFWLDTGSGGITQGVITDDLIKRVFIQRELAERIFLDLDYDSDRQGGFFEGENVYSLQYRGLEDEFLQEISAGNRYLSIPGTRLIPVDQGNASSYALRTRMGTERFRIQGLARYSQALSGQKRFRGNSQLVETEALDVSYAKRRFFFLPDSGIDEDSIRLYRSSEVPADLLIIEPGPPLEEKHFSLLLRGEDYRFDNTTGWIYLNRTLAEANEELLVYYEKGGFEVGNFSLGIDAIIDDTGARDHFYNDGVIYKDYFVGDAGGTEYLYLRNLSFNSYWEIKSAYYLAEVYSGVYPRHISVTLVSSATGERNDNYDIPPESYLLESDYGALIFAFEYGDEFYPRPFPGEDPFTPPYTPPDSTNPFDPTNPIYGGSDDPEAEDSLNTLEIRYVVDQDSFFLDFDIVEGSVRVTVDGQLLSAAYYTVDYYSGTIAFAEGVIGPTSDIEVTYRYSPLLGGNQELLLALGVDYELEWLRLRNLTTFSYPLEPPTAPLLGEERESVLGNSTDIVISLGALSGEQGWSAELNAGAALALGNKNHKKSAVVADMEEIGLKVFAGDVNTEEKSTDYTGADAFSLQYPDIYADLHGSESFRNDLRHTEQVLVSTLSSALADGESVYLTRSFGYLADLTAYKELRLYLYLPDVAVPPIPADAAVSLVLVGSTADSLDITVSGTTLDAGWNEILVELEAPYRVRLNGAVIGELNQSGSNPLSRISEIRFGVLAGTSGVTSGFEFWLDEWHLADSRYSLDVALYGETTSGYRGELSFLTDPLVSAGFEHGEGSLLDGLDRRRDAWFTGFETTLFRYMPFAVDVSGYDESAGGWFQSPSSSLPSGLEDRNTGGLYAHQIGIDSILPFLPSLEHTYQRSIRELSEVGLSQTDYYLDSSTTVGETLSFAEVFRYPRGFEQNYTFTRNWLFTDPDLTASESHSGLISYSWGRNFLSLELGREESYEVADADFPAALFESYGERLASLFRPIYAVYPDPDVALARREDRGQLTVILPRRRYLGFTANLVSSFAERDFRSGTENRDLSVENSLSLSIPISPGGKGTLELIPGLRRAFSGGYANTTGAVKELWLLGQSWTSLMMPPLYYLNPRLDQGRLNEYETVDLLAGTSWWADQVTGLGTASFDTSLVLDVRLKDPPWYLPARGNLEFAGETGREGESYTQSRSITFGLGTDFFLGRRSQNKANRLSVDAGWEGGWDYTYKVVSHSLFLNTGLDLLGGIRGQLTVDHNLSITGERQLEDEALPLVPGQPEREVTVPFQPDTNAVSSLLGLEYSREREIDPRRRELLAASRMVAGESEGGIGRISHRDRFELENNFLDVLNAEREEWGSTTLVPLRLLFTHDTVITVSEYLDLALSVKTIGGVEEIITTDPEEIKYKPALGFELRLTAILNF